MTATGCLWFVAALSESNDTWIWTSGFVLANLAFAAFGALILAYPDGRLERRDVWLVAVGGIAAVARQPRGGAHRRVTGSSRCDLVPGERDRRDRLHAPPRCRDGRGHDRDRGRAGAHRRHARPALAAGIRRRAGGRCAPSMPTCGLAVVFLLASVVADAGRRVSPTRSSGSSSCSASRSYRSRSSPACCEAASTVPRQRASSSHSTPACRSGTRSHRRSTTRRSRSSTASATARAGWTRRAARSESRSRRRSAR